MRRPFKLLCWLLKRESRTRLDPLFYVRYGVRVRRVGISEKLSQEQA
jgi:hypothetical protein